MKRKRILLTVFAVVFLTGIGAFAKHSETFGHFWSVAPIAPADDSTSRSKAENTQPEQIVPKEYPVSENVNSISLNNAAQKPLSDEIKLDVFFIRVVTMEAAAAKAEARGESGKIWRNYLRRKGFSDEEVAAVRRAAKEYADALIPIQARVVQIIKNGRDTLAKTGTLPPPPAELAQLQGERTALVTRTKNQLQNRLGVATVEKIRMLMKKSNYTQVNPAELPNLKNRLDEFKRRKGILPNLKEDHRNE